MTFVTLECVRARVWLLPSLRSVGACVWPWLPERVVVVHIPCVLTAVSGNDFCEGGSLRNEPQDPAMGYALHSGRGGVRLRG